MSMELFGVKIERNVSQSKLNKLGVYTWPKWNSGPSKIDWTFKATEIIYIIEGKAKIHVIKEHGHVDHTFEIGVGDLVTFPSGMDIIMEIIEAIDKHYKLIK